MDRTSVVRLPTYGSGGTFAFTGTAGTSAALPAGTGGVWVFCDSAAWIRVGVAVTATATDWPVPANVMIYIPVADTVTGQARVSAIQIAASGNCYFIPGV